MYSTNINNTKMEQGKYLMWTRRKQPSDYQPDLFSSPPLALRLPLRSSAIIDSRSWEEKAFAEDTAGVLGGGCIWPPRSYPCTFCGRDFRSAQALGGHMNVHRRDRARMKQSLIVEEEEKEAEEELINLNPKPNFGSLEAVSDFGEEWRMDEMDFIRLKRDLDEQDDGMKGSCKKKNKKNSTSPHIVEELDLELRLGDLPKVK